MAADTKRAQSETITKGQIERLVEADRLSEAELQALTAEELAELRSIMLRALQLNLRGAFDTDKQHCDAY